MHGNLRQRHEFRKQDEHKTQFFYYGKTILKEGQLKWRRGQQE
jgi:hypothetical protein